MARVSGKTASVPVVAPDTGENVAEVCGLVIHCTVGAGVPVALAVNVAPAPTGRSVLAGCSVIVGTAVLRTVSSAALLTVVPPELRNTARYWVPDIASVTDASFRVELVAPEMFT